MNDTYTAELVPYREGSSRVSFDLTTFKCAADGCPNKVRQILTVPGEEIGRPGKVYRVLRCLNCRFDDPCHTYYDQAGTPIKVETKFGESEHGFNEGAFDQEPVGLQWNEQEPDPELHGWQTIAGGEPFWLQDEWPQDCPVCHKEMDFILQLASATLNGRNDERGKPWRVPVDASFDMEIEYDATLYLYDCPTCRVLTTVTQCT